MKQIVTDACVICWSLVELKTVGRAEVVKPKCPQTNAAPPSVDFSSTDGNRRLIACNPGQNQIKK